MFISKNNLVQAVIFAFGTLTLYALRRPPEGFFGSDPFVVLKWMDWIVVHLGTEPFGRVGGAVMFATIAVPILFLIEWFLPNTTDEPEKIPHEQQLGGQPVAERRAGPEPAWGLILNSPWGPQSAASSWLGGLPLAPASTEWPRDIDGRPLHFFAQIDLGALKPEAETCARPPGLPRSGAMLVFIGQSCAVLIVDGDAIHRADLLPPPTDTPALEEFGFWAKGTTFPEWPVTPQAYLDDAKDEEKCFGPPEDSPAAFPYPHRAPIDWISNCGIAALEAEEVITALQNDTRQANWSLDYQVRQIDPALELASAEAQSMAFSKISSYYQLLLTDGQGMVADMQQWLSRMLAADPLAPVDPDELAQLFARREAFCEQVDANYSATTALRGAPDRLWEKICDRHRGKTPFSTMRALPQAYQRFAEDRICGWRHHRLFGIEPPFPNNPENLAGLACLISICADQLLAMQTEHGYGISLWGPENDLRSGRYDRLQVIRHCAV